MTGLVALAVSALLQAAPAGPPLALVGFRVLEMESGRTVGDQAILVEDGRITWRGAAAGFTPPDGVRVVEGAGRTLLPGLIDAHAHTDSLAFSLFLANGVTGVREMNGAERHLRWRDAIAAGTLTGPRMLVASELLTGIPFDNVRYRLVESVADARVAAAEAIRAGYDYLKIYDGLSAEEYAVFVEAGRDAGVALAGHVPADVGLDGVLAAGQGLEHAEKVVNDVLGHDPASLDPLLAAADRIARAGVPVTPTLAVQEVLTETDPEAMERRRGDDRLVYVSGGTRAWWASVGEHAAAPPPSGESRPQRYRRALRTLTRALAERGVTLFAGTDTPNPYMVPGFSLHDELEALVRAGLSPLAALRAATSVPGEAMPWATPTGRVAPGYAADLVVVEGDPLQDLATLRRPWGVVAAGRWLDRGALDGLLRSVREARGEG